MAAATIPGSLGVSRVLWGFENRDSTSQGLHHRCMVETLFRSFLQVDIDLQDEGSVITTKRMGLGQAFGVIFEHCLSWSSFLQVVNIEELSNLVEKSQKVLVSAPSIGWEKAMLKVVGDLVGVVVALSHKRADFAILLIECQNRRVINCL
jgi:hypothetical protein